MDDIHNILKGGNKKQILKCIDNIEKTNSIEYSEELFYLLEKTLVNQKKWEESCKIIELLGKFNYKKASSLIESICLEEKNNDLITMRASKCFVRLNRISLSDVTPIFKLLDTNSYSNHFGALSALGYDKMLPTNDDIKELILWTRNKYKNFKEGGLSDPRYGIAAAAVNWDKELVKDFLEECLISYDEPLKYIAKKSLEGKNVKLR